MNSETAPSAWQLIKEDYEANNRSYTKPGVQALVIHRLQVALARRSGLVAKVAGRLLQALNTVLVRNVYGLEMYPSTVIGRRLRIAHHEGVVLGRGAVIGDDCLIRQHVTLGQASDDDEAQPVIGDRVSFGPGSTVIGGVTVGDDAVVGPHALVLRNVPAGATAMASPARTLRPAQQAPAQPAAEA